MVLFAIVGELGSGKTLALTYLAWNNWLKKQRKIYSNYNFYGFPFTPVKSVFNIDKMREGFFAGDELWLWLDARCSKKEKNRIISSILLKSRKRGITIAYTTQTIGQIEKRIRDITDFVSYPIMSADNQYCRIEIFRAPNPSLASRIKPPLYFLCEPFYSVFNTYEEIRDINEEKEEEKIYRERMLSISKNPAWIKYLMEEKGIKDPKLIKKECKKMEVIINGKGLRVA